MAYNQVVFSGPFAKEDLQQLMDNIQFIYDRMVKVDFNNGVRRSDGVKVYSTTVIVPATGTTSSTVTVPFNGFFTQGTMPVVTTGIISTGVAGITQVSMAGIGGGPIIDSRGVELTAYSTLGLSSTTTIHIIAIGV